MVLFICAQSVVAPAAQTQAPVVPAATAAQTQAPTQSTHQLRVLTLDLGCGGDRSAVTDAKRLECAQNIVQKYPADILFVARGGAVAQALATLTHTTWIALPAVANGAGLITNLKQLPAKDGELWRGLGARLVSADGREVIAFAMQFPFTPYQPYQLSGIAHNEQPFLNSAEAAIASANTTRGLLSEHLAIAVRAANSSNTPVIAAGMVNEPSGADWCDKAVRAELCPMRVVWPCVLNLERATMRDAYRSVYPDVVEFPGATWPAIAKARDRFDRVDFIFTNARLHCASIQVLGEAGAKSARNPQPLSTDLPGEHRALYAVLDEITASP